MSCMLRVYGKEFAVDDFVAESRLPFYAVWRKSERKSENRTHKYSGFSLVASDADFDNVKQQIEDVMLFLQTHESELARLQHIEKIEGMVLDFGIEDRDVTVQSDRFSARLLRLAGNLNFDLEISRYPESDE